MPFFPEKLLDFFKILKAVNLYNTQLLTLRASDFQQIPGLLFLAVQRNNLTSLDGDLFSLTPTLRYLAADLNQIEHIGPNFFIPDTMRFLMLGYNPCINVNAQGRSEVLALEPQLSVLCPPLEGTTTTMSTTTLSTTTMSTTTMLASNPTTSISRNFDEEIDGLQAANLALSAQLIVLEESNAKNMEEIEKLQDLVSEFEKRMSDIEEQLEGSSTIPRVHWLSISILIASVYCKQVMNKIFARFCSV